jgi:hypothetical protein
VLSSDSLPPIQSILFENLFEITPKCDPHDRVVLWQYGFKNCELGAIPKMGTLQTDG